MAENVTTQSQVKRESRVVMLSLVAVILLVAALAAIGFFLLKPPAEVVEGQADATSVRISGKLPGRVTEILVHEGDMVHQGDTLIRIHSSLADAKLYQAQEMVNAAAAQNKKIDSGTRPQLIQGASDLVSQAQAGVEITRKTYERMENLYKENVVSEQKRDEAKAAYDASVAAKRAAESQLSLARAGAQSEDRTSAAALVGAARGGVREVEALLEDQCLVAPCDGQVDEIYPQVGELVSLGAPLMSLLKIQDKWVTFNVREDLLKDFKINDTIDVMVPALGNKDIRVAVYYLRDMGSYATWRATKATGDWDARTFQVKARPLEDLPDLRPGMTVIYRP